MAGREVSEILEALAKPILFGARQQGLAFQSIKNFHQVVSTLLDEARALDLPKESRLLIEKLARDFRDFERASVAEQAKRVRTAAARLNPEPPKEAPAASKATPLQTPVTAIKGVGKVMTERLARKNVRTVEDALFDLPLRYEDRSALLPIAQVQAGAHATVSGAVLNAQISPTRRGRKVLTVLLGDDSGSILAKWFFYRGQAPDRRFQKGNRLIASGEVDSYRGRLELHHPEIEVLEEGEAPLLPEERIIPIYALTEGLNQRFYRYVQRQIARTYTSYLPEVLPEAVLKEFNFPMLAESLLRVHCPDKDTDLKVLNEHRSPAQKRIIFEEFFFLALSVELRRRRTVQMPAAPMPQIGASSKRLALEKRLMEILPFRLTGAQQRVLEEIYRDMAQPFAMNRLLQGDVGSGKTIVALMAALRAIDNGFQVALMAPTEILAEQHHLGLRAYLEKLGLCATVLTSSVHKKQREAILSDVASGKLHMLFGTHALLEEDVAFRRLGLVVVDEQHRFGVLQRVALRKKGENPHALVMTATPIPRTLAMTVYGDLSLSILDEMPPGRTPIKTEVVRQRGREKLYRDVRNELQRGRQVFIVYPLIEESEALDLKNAIDMHEELSTRVFTEFKIALLHGRMKAEEKEAVMAALKSGEINLLVSTTVIEVGIDLPNATFMIVEHAERFGLSQLHQLRGRVGRGAHASRCVLMVEDRMTTEARQRLKIMVETADGFRIAEEDLRIRGPGEVLGTRQAGLPIFCYADLRRDAEILHDASRVARDILDRDANLEHPENARLREALQARWQGRLQLSRIG